MAAVDFSADSCAALAWAQQLAGEASLDAVHVLEPELNRTLAPAEREHANAEMRAIAGNLMNNLRAQFPGNIAGHIETGYVPAQVLELVCG